MTSTSHCNFPMCPFSQTLDQTIDVKWIQVFFLKFGKVEKPRTFAGLNREYNILRPISTSFLKRFLKTWVKRSKNPENTKHFRFFFTNSHHITILAISRNPKIPKVVFLSQLCVFEKQEKVTRNRNFSERRVIW